MWNSRRYGFMLLLIGTLAADPIIMHLLQRGELTITVMARDGYKATFGHEGKFYKKLATAVKNIEQHQDRSGAALALNLKEGLAISDVH